jgi:HK97 gp10 family phage protein
MSWSVKIIGDTVTPKLAAFAGKIEKAVEAELDVVGADMEDLAKSLVPVRTGYLQSTIYHTATGFILDFGAEADYASYVEFGTYRMAPRPYLRPALDGSSQKILDAIMTGCMNALGV